MKLFYFLFFMIIMLPLCLGCAKTVTQVVIFGDQLVVEVTLRGTMEVGANRYFLVLSSQQLLGSSPNFKVPLPPPDNYSFEFIEPGMTPQLGSIADYYTNYYSTWAGYVMVEPAGNVLVKGPFVLGQSTTREVLSSLGTVSSKIKFNFRLSQIFGDSVPNPIYFDFVAVNWPADSAKMAADHLASTNAYFSKVSGTTITIQDEENNTLNSSLDILDCTVTVQ